VKTFILMSFIFSLNALANPKIEQVDTSRNRVAAKSTTQTVEGTEWIATLNDGTQCTLKVEEKIGNLAILKPMSCGSLSQLRVGQTMTKNLLATTEVTKSNSQGRSTLSGKNWGTLSENLKGFSFIGFYSMADDVPFSANGTKFKAIGESSWGLGGEYEKYLGESIIDGLPIGIIGGATYEFAREFTNRTGPDGKVQFQEKPSFSLWTLYANSSIYLTNRFAGLLGVNYPIALEKNFNDEKLKSSLGFQLGATAGLTPNVSIDAMYRWVNLKTATISDMSLDGFVLRGRYVF
jgi:opacity protein-like surface antigen